MPTADDILATKGFFELTTDDVAVLLDTYTVDLLAALFGVEEDQINALAATAVANGDEVVVAKEPGVAAKPALEDSPYIRHKVWKVKIGVKGSVEIELHYDSRDYAKLAARFLEWCEEHPESIRGRLLDTEREEFDDRYLNLMRGDLTEENCKAVVNKINGRKYYCGMDVVIDENGNNTGFCEEHLDK